MNYLVDITDFMTSFISLMQNGVSYVFDTLDSISFLGTTLLRFSITIFILPIILTILLSLVKSLPSQTENYRGKHEYHGKHESEE